MAQIEQGKESNALARTAQSAPSMPKSPFQKGESIFGRYFVLDILQSPNSTIIKAVDNDTSHEVAIKQVPLLGGDWEKWRLVHREFYAGMNLDHPNLTCYHGFHENEAGFFIVRDWAEGESLHDLLKKGVRFTERQIFSILTGVLDAVEYLHLFPRPIIHRDITPTNIIIDMQNRGIMGVKLIDLDAVANLHDSDPDVRQTMTLAIGTRGYLAPEAIFDPCPQSDLFSIGAVALRMFRDENAEAVYDYRRLAFRKRPEALKEIPDGRLREFLRRSLAPVEARFQTAGEMKLALARLRGEECAILVPEKQTEIAEALMSGSLKESRFERRVDSAEDRFKDGFAVCQKANSIVALLAAIPASIYYNSNVVGLAIWAGAFVAPYLLLIPSYFVFDGLKIHGKTSRKRQIAMSACDRLLNGDMTDPSAQETLCSIIRQAEPNRRIRNKAQDILAAGVLSSEKAESAMLGLIDTKRAMKLLEINTATSVPVREGLLRIAGIPEESIQLMLPEGKSDPSR